MLDLLGRRAPDGGEDVDEVRDPLLLGSAHDLGARVGHGALELLQDRRRLVEDVDPALVAARRRRHLRRGVLEVHDPRAHLGNDPLGHHQCLAEPGVEPHGDVPQFGRQRERLAIVVFFGAPRKDLLHAKELAADRVNLPVPPIVRMVALREDGLAMAIHPQKLREGSNDLDVVAVPALVRFDDDGSIVEQRRHRFGVRRLERHQAWTFRGRRFDLDQDVALERNSTIGRTKSRVNDRSC